MLFVANWVSQLTLSPQKRFIFLLLLTPVFWLALFNIKEALEIYAKIPHLILEKRNFFPDYQIWLITELRWETPVYKRDPLLTRTFYNKVSIFFNRFAGILKLYSPMVYFESSNIEKLPKNIEILPLSFLPFWFLGILHLVKNISFKPLLLSIPFALFTYLTKENSLFFLLPLAIFGIYLTNLGIQTVSKNKRSFIILFLLLYSVFLLGRNLWLIF